MQWCASVALQARQSTYLYLNHLAGILVNMALVAAVANKMLLDSQLEASSYRLRNLGFNELSLVNQYIQQQSQYLLHTLPFVHMQMLCPRASQFDVRTRYQQLVSHEIHKNCTSHSKLVMSQTCASWCC